MSQKKGILYLLKNIREKHRLSVRDQHNDNELWYIFLSPINIFAGFLALVLVLFIIILTTVAYTPILDFIPGYPGKGSRELLVQSIMRLDSLERELDNAQIYGDNIALISEGKSPVMRTLAQGPDEERPKEENVKASVEDSLLRLELEGDGRYGLNTTGQHKVKKIHNNLELVSPARGVVSETFDPQNGRYGSALAVGANTQVVSIEDGNVVLSLWSPEKGFVVSVQHNNNLISTYKGLTSSLKGVGQRVKAGEVIGSIDSPDGARGVLDFELWLNGSPVDPQGYIIF